MSAVAGRPIGGHDTALLHVVAYQDRPKGLSEIARLLGRTDIANIQYAIRKLARLGLIAPLAGRSRKDTLYEATPAGDALISGYRALRRELLVSLAEMADADFPDLDRRLVRSRRRGAEAIERQPAFLGRPLRRRDRSRPGDAR
jgi:predicted MarR family transcription regulator